ncbi:DUF3558 domain-containing protein [Gordonia tangerina]|uniref:DUF3558 domain-containing protein n=1 Tax=Gordonia tangerina TaxID=2911060 RepID=UPI003557B468
MKRCSIPAVALALSACTASGPATEQPSMTLHSSAIRQTDEAGNALPFENTYPKRWNASNDGTPYEPCTAVDREVAAEIGLDFSTSKDAASVSGQTLRGCRWQYIDEDVSGWRANQVIGDFESLESYKAMNEVFTWLPEIQIDGRRVGVAHQNDFSCFTYVQSGGSGVVTEALYTGNPNPPLTEICQRAIDLTKATIDKIPE